MLQIATEPTTEQLMYRENETTRLLLEKGSSYAGAALENIVDIQNYVNNILRLKRQYRYDLYHVTVTWKKTPFCYRPEYVQKDFNRFYLRLLLPFLMRGAKLNRSSYAQQPICLSCVDKGSNGVTKTGNQADLHNHSIIAGKRCVSAQLNRYKVDPEALIVAIRQFVCSNYAKGSRKHTEGMALLDLIVRIVIVPVTNEELQTGYPLKKYGQFSNYVSQFPKSIDWEDIEISRKRRRSSSGAKRSQPRHSDCLSDGRNHSLETYF